MAKRTTTQGRATTRRAPNAAQLQKDLRASETALAIAQNNAASRVIARVSGWEAARSDRRRANQFYDGSGDYHLDTYTRQKMVQSSRHMVRNNPLYKALLSRLVDLVVGAGMRPQAATDDPNWNQQAEALFNEWGRGFVDARGRMTWSMLQRHVCGEAFAAGDVLSIKGADPLVQVIESERLVSPHGAAHPRTTRTGSGDQAGQPRIFDGVEMDAQGRALGYYISDWNAGGPNIGGGFVNPSGARKVGARDAMHLAVIDQPSQTRGAPILASCMTTFTDLHEYLEAHQQSAKVQAFFAIIWKSMNTGADRLGLATGTGYSGSGRSVDETELESGAVAHVGPNDSIEALRSNAPSALSDPFVRGCMTRICAAVGVPMNYAMLDFERMNYSSARAALITAMDGFQHWRNWFAAGFMAPVWRWRIAQLMRSGALPWNDQWTRVAFTRPTFGWVDPVKEVQGYDSGVRAGLVAPQDATAQHSGEDWRDVLRKRKEYLAECERLGIEPPGMMQAAPGSAPQPEEKNADKAGDEDDKPQPDETNAAPIDG